MGEAPVVDHDVQRQLIGEVGRTLQGIAVKFGPEPPNAAH